MGVHGLWRLIDPSGKPVPLESLENKVLAVDISIWLHQAVKGFQDSRGASVPNAHLLGIYHRVCKLLYFRIKPVFVFDGGVPALKKQTIAKRTQSKLRTISQADKIQRELLNTLLKHTAVSKVLTEKIEASIGTIPKPSTRSTRDNMYILPSGSELESTISSSDDESYSESTTDSSPTKNWDLHTIDMESVHFKSLPVDVRHEILTDLKDTRKQSSWGRLHELPKVSDDFSIYQMRRLLKRQAVQTALEDAEKEMGGKSLSLVELESILKDQGVITNQDIGNRIASDDTTKYLLVKDVKQALEDAKKKDQMLERAEKEIITITLDEEEENAVEAESKATKTKADIEYEDALKRAIALSLENEPSTSEKHTQKSSNTAELSFLENFTDADFASNSSEEEEQAVKHDKTKLSSAKSYMLEYSGLTPSEIDKIINTNVANDESKKLKLKRPNLPVVEENCQEITSTTNNMVNSTSVECVEKRTDESIEIMSSTDSSDCEIDAQMQSVVINPNSQYNEDDDLFADVFISANLKNQVSSSVETSSSDKGTTRTPGLDVVVSTTEEFDEKEIEESSILIMTDNDLAPHKSDVNENVDTLPLVVVEEGTSEPLNELAVAENDTNIEPKVKTPQNPPMTEGELKQLQDQLQRDRVDLLNEKSAKERMAGNITDQMYQEAQELLELFGVPYIIAPMEAEAQCAFLNAIDLTDGTITDDSDIWLFGGKTVYKNFFNQSKYVMEFRVENIQHHFKLTREQMILLALLVGSDYTIGLQGVGPVTAMEILAAFPPGKGKMNAFSLSHPDLLSGLQEFKSWFTKGKSPGPGRSALKSKLKNLHFSENFPSLQVVQAYLDPTVETSRDDFSWGKPHALALLDFAREKFGWTKTKTEEILNPVLKKLEESKHQKSIRDYFKTRFKVHSDEARSKMSKRIKSAVTNMGRDPSEVLAEELQEELKKAPRTRARRNKKEGKEAPEFKKSRKPSTQKHETNELGNSDDVKNKKSKVQLHNLKLTSEPQDEANNIDDTDITEKIDRIRRRRKIKEAKAAVEIKKPKVVKEKKTPSHVLENIPNDLVDEEIHLLSQVVAESGQKVEDINRSMLERLQSMEKKSLEEFKSNASPSTSNQPQPSSSGHRPAFRPTRIPRKESIPQKEKDKSTVLRNRLKAIEVFRRGKHGPGYVLKKERKKRLPKEDAELSESSDE